MGGIGSGRKRDESASDRTIKRDLQRMYAEIYAQPWYKQRLRNLRRRRYPNRRVETVQWWCGHVGRKLGGRPPKYRRCTKRLGTRFCWNWRVDGTDRCRLHPRGRGTRQTQRRKPRSERRGRRSTLMPMGWLNFVSGMESPEHFAKRRRKQERQHSADGAASAT